MSSFEHVNIEDMLQKIVQIMTKCYDVHNVFVFFGDTEKGLGKIRINTGVFAEFKIDHNVEKFIMEEVSKKQKTVIVNIMETQNVFFKDKISDKISTLILIPLKYAGDLFGIIGVAGGKNEKLVEGEKLCFLESFVDMIAAVLSKTSKVAYNKEKEIKELRQVVEKYFQVFYMSPNAIALLNSDETFTEVNPSFTLILGFAKEEAIGKSMKDLRIWVNLDDRERIRQMLAESNKTQNIELPLHKKDGEVIYAQIIVRKGTLQGKMCYLVVARDISMQVAAKAKQDMQEEELILSRNKLATAATLASIGPWEYDTKKEIFEFSDEFYALYGTNSVREGKFMGFADYIREFIHPEDVWMFSGEKEILSLALPDNSTVPDIIHRIIRRDGEVRTVLVRRRFIRDADGNMIKAYGTNQDITERIRIEEEQLKQANIIKHMAYYDSLTGLPNRNNLNEWLSEHMDTSKHNGAIGTVFLFDLDQLKMVNDAYGHSFGDRVITNVSARLVDVFGVETFIARIGGDEFIIILPGEYTKEQIEIKAQKAIESISKKQEYLDMSMHVTVSVGIAHYPKDGDTVEEIIKNVENAMYKAKKMGEIVGDFIIKKCKSQLTKKYD